MVTPFTVIAGGVHVRGPQEEAILIADEYALHDTMLATQLKQCVPQHYTLVLYS